MNIVGISACTSGIAHTYIAKEKLIKAGQEMGHKVRTKSYMNSPHNIVQIPTVI
jgi:fructose PTS system EIIB component